MAPHGLVTLNPRNTFKTRSRAFLRLVDLPRPWGKKVTSSPTVAHSTRSWPKKFAAKKFAARTPSNPKTLNPIKPEIVFVGISCPGGPISCRMHLKRPQTRFPHVWAAFQPMLEKSFSQNRWTEFGSTEFGSTPSGYPL